MNERFGHGLVGCFLCLAGCTASVDAPAGGDNRVAGDETSMGGDTFVPGDSAVSGDAFVPGDVFVSGDAFNPCAGVVCSGHGVCSAGSCRCYAGYLGESCTECDDGYTPSEGDCLSTSRDLSTIIGEMQPGVWRQIEATPLAPELLTREEANAIHPAMSAVSGPASVISIWTSAAFDGERYWYFGAGGGHLAYNGNELYRFDFVNLVWDRLYDPSPLAYQLGDGDWMPEWGPKASHHYDGMIYSAKVNSIFLWPSNSYRFRFDLTVFDATGDASQAWSPIEGPPFEVGYTYYKTAILPDSGNIILYGGGTTQVAEYDPETALYSRYGGMWDSVWAEYTVADIDPVRRRVYSVNDDAVLSIDIDADPLGDGGQQLPDSVRPPSLAKNGCFIHHPVSELMIAWGGERAIYTFNPEGNLWSTIDNAAGPAPTSSHDNGPLGKCAYLAAHDTFAFYNNENEGVWLYQLP